MSNLIKIDSIRFNIGLSTDASMVEQLACRKILVDEAIPHGVLMYSMDDYSSVLGPLSSWVFGLEMREVLFTDFPVITWTEYYDDYNVVSECAASSAELATSNLVKFKNLIVAN